MLEDVGRGSPSDGSRPAFDCVVHCGECGQNLRVGFDVDASALTAADIVRLLREKFGADGSTVCPRCQSLVFLEFAGVRLSPSDRLQRANVAYRQATKEQVARFAVGSPDANRSGAWRVWTHGKHAYIAARSLGSQLKVSLHPGYWYYGFTAPYAARAPNLLPPGADRKLHVWDRPPEFGPGWTRAFEIIVPSSEVVATPEPFRGRELIWLPVPPQGHSTHITVLLSTPNAERGRRGFPHAAGHEENTELVTRLPIGTGETLWVIAHVEPTAPVDIAKLEEVRAHMKAVAGAELRRRRAENPAFHPRAVVFGDRTDGSRAFLDISLHPIVDEV